MSAWLEKLYETFIASGGYRYILEGFQNTIVITMGAGDVYKVGDMLLSDND